MNAELRKAVRATLVTEALPKAKRERVANPWAKHESLALAVHPNRIEEATKDAAARGISVEFSKEGLPKFRSRNEQKKYCRAYGYVNYGDIW